MSTSARPHSRAQFLGSLDPSQPRCA
jgi:hypothetical protein